MTEERFIQLIAEHLAQRLDDIKETQDKGFEKINTRLDLQNGRLRKAEDNLNEIRTVGKTVSVIYGMVISLLGLAGGCTWVQASISHGKNSPAPTERSIPSSGAQIGPSN